MTKEQLFKSIVGAAYSSDDEPENGLAESDLYEAFEVVLKHVPEGALYELRKEILEVALKHVPDNALHEIKSEIEHYWAASLD